MEATVEEGVAVKLIAATKYLLSLDTPADEEHNPSACPAGRWFSAPMSSRALSPRKFRQANSKSRTMLSQSIPPPEVSHVQTT